MSKAATRGETGGEWYAVRTVPGAQLPQREYATEPTALGKDGKPRGKGYRIVVSLDPRKSAIEKSLSDAGFSYYMPAEYRAVRERRRTKAYTVRRFPMLQGYVFVHGVTDFGKLADVAGVAEIVMSGGNPAAIIGNGDILTLLAIEGRSQAEAHDAMEKWRAHDEAAARKATGKAIQKAKRRFQSGTRVKVIWGEHVGHEATVASWKDHQSIKLILDKLDSVESVVSYEEIRVIADAA